MLKEIGTFLGKGAIITTGAACLLGTVAVINY
jgi:hypothetical protein